MSGLCRQGVSPEPWSERVVWRFEEVRPRPYGDVSVVVFEDGSSPCSRCGSRHPWDQMLSREGLHPRGSMPMGWGSPAAGADEAGPDAAPLPEVF